MIIGKNKKEESVKDQTQEPVKDQTQEPVNTDNPSYDFEFKFVEGIKEVEKKVFTGTGNESVAIAEARKQADKYSDGRYIVVFTGQFKKLN